VAPHPAPEGSAGEPGSGPESPLQAAPDHEPFRRFSALRAFPPALCVLARVGRNAGTRAVLCACARGQAVRPAWSREWARLPAAPPRPAFAPPFARHFVLRRVLCAWRAGPPRDGHPEVGTTNAQAPGLRCLQVILLPAERRWGLELAAVPNTHTQTLACTNPRVSTFSYVHDLEDVLGPDSVRICVCTGPGVHGHVYSRIWWFTGAAVCVTRGCTWTRECKPHLRCGPLTRSCFRPVLDSFALAQFTCKAPQDLGDVRSPSRVLSFSTGLQRQLSMPPHS
ncbi:hypothetical protein H8959_004715, partial [Pygathrix nigripes]